MVSPPHAELIKRWNLIYKTNSNIHSQFTVLAPVFPSCDPLFFFFFFLSCGGGCVLIRRAEVLVQTWRLFTSACKHTSLCEELSCWSGDFRPQIRKGTCEKHTDQLELRSSRRKEMCRSAVGEQKETKTNPSHNKPKEINQNSSECAG